MEPWYVLMVEVPLQLGKKDRINNKCRLVILAPYKPRNHEIYNGSGEVSCTFFLSHTDGLTSKGLSGSVYLYGKGEDIRSGPVYQKDIGEDTLT